MFSATDLIKPIVKAIQPALGKGWDDAKEFATTEARKLAHTLVTVVTLATQQKINAVQARALVDMQKNAMQSVLLTVEIIGLVAAQNAINAAIAAIKQVVNKAAPFKLLD